MAPTDHSSSSLPHAQPPQHPHCHPYYGHHHGECVSPSSASKYAAPHPTPFHPTTACPLASKLTPGVPLITRPVGSALALGYFPSWKLILVVVLVTTFLSFQFVSNHEHRVACFELKTTTPLHPYPGIAHHSSAPPRFLTIPSFPTDMPPPVHHHHHHHRSAAVGLGPRNESRPLGQPLRGGNGALIGTLSSILGLPATTALVDGGGGTTTGYSTSTSTTTSITVFADSRPSSLASFGQIPQPRGDYDQYDPSGSSVIRVEVFDQQSSRSLPVEASSPPSSSAPNISGNSSRSCAFPLDADRVPPKSMHLLKFTSAFEESIAVPEMAAPPDRPARSCITSVFPTRSAPLGMGNVRWHFNPSAVASASNAPPLTTAPSSVSSNSNQPHPHSIISGSHNDNPGSQKEEIVVVEDADDSEVGAGATPTLLDHVLRLPSNLDRAEWAQLNRHITSVMFNASHSVGGYLVFALQIRQNEGPLTVLKGPTYLCVTHADGRLLTAHRFARRVWSPKFVNHTTVAMVVTSGDTRFDVQGESEGLLWNWQTGDVVSTNLQSATHDVDFDPVTNSWITIQRRIHGPAYCTQSGFVIHPNLTYGMECVTVNKTANRTFPLWVDTLAEIRVDGSVVWEWNPLLLFNQTNTCFMPHGFPQNPRETCIRRLPIAFLPTTSEIGPAAISRMWRYPLYKRRMLAFRELHRAAAPLDMVHGNTVTLDGANHEFVFYHCAYLNTFFKLERRTRKVIWATGQFLGLRCEDYQGEMREACTHHAHGLQKIGEDARGELFVTFDNDARNLERMRDHYKKIWTINGELTEIPRFSRLLMFRVNAARHHMKEVGYWLRPNAHFLPATSIPKSFNRFAGGAVQYFPFGGAGNIQGSFMDYHVEYTSDGYIAAMMFVDSGGFLHSANRFFSHPIVQIERLRTTPNAKDGGVSTNNKDDALQVCVYDVALMSVGRSAEMTLSAFFDEKDEMLLNMAHIPSGDGSNLHEAHLIYRNRLRLMLFPRWTPTCVVVRGIASLSQHQKPQHPTTMWQISVTIDGVSTTVSFSLES